jgi:hypothetical protein
LCGHVKLLVVRSQWLVGVAAAYAEWRGQFDSPINFIPVIQGIFEMMACMRVFWPISVISSTLFSYGATDELSAIILSFPFLIP